MAIGVRPRPRELRTTALKLAMAYLHRHPPDDCMLGILRGATELTTIVNAIMQHRTWRSAMATKHAKLTPTPSWREKVRNWVLRMCKVLRDKAYPEAKSLVLQRVGIDNELAATSTADSLVVWSPCKDLQGTLKERRGTTEMYCTSLLPLLEFAYSGAAADAWESKQPAFAAETRRKGKQTFHPTDYGEVMPVLIDKIIREVNLLREHTFVDLGSGVGTVVQQVGLQVGCKLSLGIECIVHRTR